MRKNGVFSRLFHFLNRIQLITTRKINLSKVEIYFGIKTYSAGILTPYFLDKSKIFQNDPEDSRMNQKILG
jgi:hypothetical protein